MQKVFVLDKNKQSLMPCSIQRARQLLSTGKAAVFRLHPFTLILKNREKGGLQNIAVKIDPGSKVSGVSLVGNFEQGQEGDQRQLQEYFLLCMKNAWCFCMDLSKKHKKLLSKIWILQGEERKKFGGGAYETK